MFPLQTGSALKVKTLPPPQTGSLLRLCLPTQTEGWGRPGLGLISLTPVATLW